jgi:hypothetical protein
MYNQSKAISCDCVLYNLSKIARAGKNTLKIENEEDYEFRGAPQFCIFSCISGFNGLTNSALYEPLGEYGSVLLNISIAAIPYERDFAEIVPYTYGFHRNLFDITVGNKVGVNRYPL